MSTYKKRPARTSYLEYIQNKINEQPRLGKKIPNGLDLLDKNVGRKKIPNYTLRNGYHMGSMSLSDKIQTVSLMKNALDRFPIEKPHIIRDINQTEGINYGKVQDVLDDIDLTETSLEVNDINGGSIFSSIFDLAKKALPSIVKGVKSLGNKIINKPSIITDVVKTGKDVIDIIKPPKKTETAEEKEPLSLKEEAYRLLSQRLITPEQFISLLNSTLPEKSKKEEPKKPEIIIKEEPKVEPKVELKVETKNNEEEEPIKPKITRKPRAAVKTTKASEKAKKLFKKKEVKSESDSDSDI